MSPQEITTTTKAKGKAPTCPQPYRHEDLIISRATMPDIIHRTWTNNMEEWAKGVPLAQYHAREKHLASTAFSSDDRLITWVLVPKPDAEPMDEYKAWSKTEEATAKGHRNGVHGGFDPQDGSELNLERILGAVETYERPGIVATVAADGQNGHGDGELKDVKSVSVASVYSPSKYRSHGYGKLMMKLLWTEIERMGVSFSFLYSDLGTQFYTNLGWTARMSAEIVLPPSLALPASSSSSQDAGRTTRASSTANSVGLKPIADKSCLQSIVDMDASLLRRTLQEKVIQRKQELAQSLQAGDTKRKNTTFVAVTPEIRCIQWLYARAYFNAKEFWKFEDKNPMLSLDKDLNYGIQVSGRDDQFVLWHHDFTDDNLFILRWRIHSSPADLDAIALAFAEAAQKEAKKWGLSKVVYWNADPALARLLGLEIKHRNHSITSLGLVNSDQDEDTVEWILNEKYSWC